MNTARSSEIRSIPNPAHTAHLLQQLFPPQAAIVVGANRSHRYLLDWPSVRPDHILLVDAQPEGLADIRQKIATAGAWQMRHAVLADREQPARFFRASNPGEDGLVPPHKLAALWPNLHTTDEQACTTQTLGGLLAEPELAALAETRNAWLVIDCLPALRILQGAGPLLERCRLLWLRVLLEPLEDGEPGTTLEEAERYLADHHFRRIHCIEENHPRIGQAIFLLDDGALREQEIARLTAEQLSLTQAEASLAHERDGLRQQNSELVAACDALRTEKTTLLAERDALQQDKAALAAEHDVLTQERATLTAARNTLAQEKTALTKAHDEQAKLASERQAKIAALNQAKTELTAARDKLAGERDQQARLASERQAQLEALTQEKAEALKARDALAQEKAALAKARDGQVKLASERQAQIEALTQQKTELFAARAALAQEKAVLAAAHDEQAELASVLASTRDSQTQLIAERDERILQLEANLQESVARLRLMQDELVKGEAQIELIKDLLLREPEL